MLLVVSQVPLLLLALNVAGCTTRVVVEQPKPLEINVNLSGNLNLFLQDARQNLEQITGEKPRNIIRPEDIGLPAAPTPPPGARADGAGAWVAAGEEDADVGLTYPVRWTPPAARVRGTAPILLQSSEQDLTRSMAARNAKIQALWAGGLVGESHTGLLVTKGQLNEEQQQLFNAENADRTALYAAEAARKKVKADEVALIYYMARLGYAKKGAWYEVRNPTTNEWAWKQWAQ
jgi:uncharacterized protein YdbL (DUF1318 family)